MIKESGKSRRERRKSVNFSSSWAFKKGGRDRHLAVRARDLALPPRHRVLRARVWQVCGNGWKSDDECLVRHACLNNKINVECVTSVSISLVTSARSCWAPARRASTAHCCRKCDHDSSGANHEAAGTRSLRNCGKQMWAFENQDPTNTRMRQECNKQLTSTQIRTDKTADNSATPYGRRSPNAA